VNFILVYEIPVIFLKNVYPNCAKHVNLFCRNRENDHREDGQEKCTRYKGIYPSHKAFPVRKVGKQAGLKDFAVYLPWLHLAAQATFKTLKVSLTYIENK
jgi:hypothetical protein